MGRFYLHRFFVQNLRTPRPAGRPRTDRTRGQAPAPGPATVLACLEDIDYRSPRGQNKALLLQLSSGQWLRAGLNLIIGGATGVGKTWLA